jgi:hypothetical protein
MRGLRFGGVIVALVAGLVCVPGALSAAPSNDNFANAETMINTLVVRSSAEATKEPGEPDHAGNAGGASIWFKWHADADGLVSFSTYRHFDTLLAVYTGTTLSDLVEIASNDDYGIGGSLVGFAAAAGQDYWIAVDGKDGATGWVHLERRAAERPSNDAFTAPRELSGEQGSSCCYSTFLATKETDEPDHAGEPGGASVWYTWTAPRSGVVELTTRSSSFDTVLAAYTGDTLDALTEVASNDDDGYSLQSSFDLQVAAGTSYRIAVDGVDGETGTASLDWRMRPRNDNLQDAEPISGTSGSLNAFTYYATHEPSEPHHAGEPGTGSLWYRWTPDIETPIRFDTCGSPYFDTLLAVYTGAAIGTLTEVGSADDSCGIGAFVEFAASAGATYWIAIDGFEYTGEFNLRWSLPLPKLDSPPEIKGAVVEGGNIELALGQWRYATSVTHSSWRSCPADETTLTIRCSRLSVPLQQRITIPFNTYGRRIGIFVTGTGPGGSTGVAVLSQPVGYGLPVNKVRPSVLGLVTLGATLRTTDGTWELGSAPRLSLNYLWERCDRAGANCGAVKGPGADTSYDLTFADVGFTIRSVVAMTSAGGTTNAVSIPTDVLVQERTVQQPTVQQPGCRVPRLIGKRLLGARKMLSRARCRLGPVRKVRSARKAGLIVRQRPKSGARLRAGGKVTVFVSKGRRR